MINANQVTDIDRNEVIASVAANSYEIIRGLIDPKDVTEGITKMKARFSTRDDHGSSDVDPKMILQNFQKWSVGSLSPKSESNARLMRIFYNPLWCEDIYSLHGIFHRLVETRNHLQGMNLDYAKNIEENKLYSACRVQYYPKGGGFMQAHTDWIGVENIDNTDVSKFIQILVVLSKKGIDFKRGGGFVTRKDGTKAYIEEHAEPGDIIIYDGSTIHGCEDVDPHLPLDTSVLDGRFVGIATIYKVWESQAKNA